MPDKTQHLMLDALTVAMAEPAGRALHGSKSQPGLFPSSLAAKQAAERCKELGYLNVVRTEERGKKTNEICSISEKGIAFLLNELNPKQIMESFTSAVEERGREVCALIQAAQHCQSTLAALKSQVEKVLTKVQSSTAPVPPPSTNGPGPWKTDALSYLTQFQQTKPSEDCPLPELYRQAQKSAAALTVGQFHDGLRQLHDQDQVILHPWTGPLYEIPEPVFALMSGHSLAYYASRK